MSEAQPSVTAPRGLDVVIAAVVAVAVLVITIAAMALLPRIVPGWAGEPARPLLATSVLLVVQNLAMLGGVAVAAWRRRVSPVELLGLHPLRPRQVVGFAGFGCAIGIGLGIALQFLQQVFDQPVRTPGAEMLAPEGFSWTALVLMLLIGGLLAPFAEEVLFRGLLFGWLRRRLPPAWAALVAALPFGLVHIQPEHVAYATAAGFLLALLYQRAGSLWAPIVAHVTINLIAISYVYLALALGMPLGDV